MRKFIAAGICIFICIIVYTPAWACKGVPVIIYHEIVDSPQEKPLGGTVITLDKFREQMRYLFEHGFTTLSMRELVDYAQSKKEVPEKSVVITFDDGWRSQLNALAILEQYGMKASFWVITGEGYGDAYFSADDLKKIDSHPNWEVESHTVTHPWNPRSNLLTWLRGRPKGKTREDVRRELVDSKAMLERLLDRKITMLAWPCGWYNKTLVRMAQDAGYDVLLTIIEGPNCKGTDILKIRRFFINGNYSLDIFQGIVERGQAPFSG